MEDLSCGFRFMCLFGKEQNMLGVFVKGSGRFNVDRWLDKLFLSKIKRQVHFVPAGLPPFHFLTHIYLLNRKGLICHRKIR